MPESETPAVREALEHVRECADLVFEALLSPYEALANADPSTPIGQPTRIPEYPYTSGVRAVVEEAAKNGKGAWSLHQVDERQKQISDLIHEYRSGRYAKTSAAEWVSKVRTFRDAVQADVNTAMQAPRGWDRLDLLNGGKTDGIQKNLLSPRDVAPELKLAERTVRRRILEGHLGPWRKQGSRWVISREEFLRFWADRLLETDSDIPHPPKENHDLREVEERLDHVRLRPEA